MRSAACSSTPWLALASAAALTLAGGATAASPPSLADGQLAGQRIVTAFRGTTITPSLRDRIRHGEIAGVILFARNVTSLEQTRRLVADIQAVPRPVGLRAPLLVMVDQEGGRVRRLPGGPRGASLIASDAEARAAGDEAGRLLRSVGANVDLAPVADLGLPGGAIAGEGRTYGRSPAVVASRVLAFHRGLVGTGIVGAAKHYPGLGGASRNTDDASVTIRRPAPLMRERDGVPFGALVRDGIAMVMMSSAVYPALDARPALMSRAIVEGGLRSRLRFDGVIVTDSLNARALRRHGGPGPVSVRAAGAGVDLMLATSEGAATEVQRALITAYRTGVLRRDRAERSVQRVLDLRGEL